MKIKIQIISLLMLLAACEPETKLTNTWTDPSVTPATFQSLKKVLVIARLKDETTDRTAEDKIAYSYKLGKAVQSYMYLNQNDTNQTAVDTKMKKDGFDGIIVMRLIDVEKSIDVYTSGYGGGYYGYGPYYHGGYGMTTVTENHNYRVEAKIWSIESGKMLWSGTTSTYNPTSLDKSLGDIMTAIRNQFVKQGLLTP